MINLHSGDMRDGFPWSGSDVRSLNMMKIRNWVMALIERGPTQVVARWETAKRNWRGEFAALFRPVHPEASIGRLLRALEVQPGELASSFLREDVILPHNLFDKADGTAPTWRYRDAMFSQEAAKEQVHSAG
jgi:hypothetical protein